PRTVRTVERSDALGKRKDVPARLLARMAPRALLEEPIQLAQAAIEAKVPVDTGLAHGVLAEIKLRCGDLPGAEAEARAACEALIPCPAWSWDLIAFRMRILLEQGRAPEALQIGEDALQHLERLGVAGFGEIHLRLAVAEALHAVGRTDAAHA